MLNTLFGNRNIERILFFLFVNEQCYGTQLQKLLEIPLTPIQQALYRLEKEEILNSHYEGKIRIYQFNPAYPLRWELETLLKKAYTLLPSQEKKRYCFLRKQKLSTQDDWQKKRSRKKELFAFWERLLRVEQLSLVTKPRYGEDKLIKTGKAEVTLTMPDSSTAIFNEKGYWLENQQPHTRFSNSFRWSLDTNISLITLEHLRQGSNRPVFLFHLTPIRKNRLESISAHLCGEDTYLGNLTWDLDQIIFHWRVIGPKKNDELIYHYV